MDKKKRIRHRPAATRSGERAKALERYWTDPVYRQKQKDRANKSKRKRKAEGYIAGYFHLYRKARETWPLAAIVSIKNRCKKSGIPFDLTPEDIYVPSHCPVLGFELVFGGKVFGVGLKGPSVDRIHPEKGYVKGNVIVISMRANRLKCDCSSSDELRKVIGYIDRTNADGVYGVYPREHVAHDKQTIIRPKNGIIKKEDMTWTS